MSVNITTAFVKQYDNNYMLLYQQGGSKLRGHVPGHDETDIP